MSYQDYLNSPRWHKIRLWRLWIDSYRCVCCHEKDHLNVHHASYIWKGKLGRIGSILECLDTVTLCKVCHFRIHNNRSIQDFAD